MVPTRRLPGFREWTSPSAATVSCAVRYRETHDAFAAQPRTPGCGVRKETATMDLNFTRTAAIATVLLLSLSGTARAASGTLTVIRTSLAPAKSLRVCPGDGGSKSGSVFVIHFFVCLKSEERERGQEVGGAARRAAARLRDGII